jgi:FSR family fosmidomycin resistance protein-like MFS transporter
MNTISNTDLKADNPAVAQNHLFSFVLFAFAHLINDLMQSVIPSTYPILKENFSLNFTQIG